MTTARVAISAAARLWQAQIARNTVPDPTTNRATPPATKVATIYVALKVSGYVKVRTMGAIAMFMAAFVIKYCGRLEKPPSMRATSQSAWPSQPRRRTKPAQNIGRTMVKHHLNGMSTSPPIRLSTRSHKWPLTYTLIERIQDPIKASFL